MNVRKATPADKDAVVALCRAIEPHDYIPDMFDQSAAVEAPGGLHVAEQDGRIVGCHAVDWPAPGNAFFFGMRIHPEVQGQGIGTAYCKAQVEAAVQAGARHCFLTSALPNVRAHRAVEKNGFVNRGEWVIWEETPAPAIPAEPGRARAGRPEDLPQVAEFLARLAGAEMADLLPAIDYPYGFSVAQDDDWAVADLVVVEGAGGLEGVMLLRQEAWNSAVYIRRLEGTPQAAAELLGYAKAWGDRQGLQKWCISLAARCEPLLAPLGLSAEGCERWYMFHYRVK